MFPNWKFAIRNKLDLVKSHLKISEIQMKNVKNPSTSV
jgi:hypothetical protein